jgi:hypothetical protein
MAEPGTVSAGTLLKHGDGLLDLTDDVLGVVREMPPGESQDCPIRAHQDVLPAPIVMKTIMTAVKGETVDLDDQSEVVERLCRPSWLDRPRPGHVGFGRDLSCDCRLCFNRLPHLGTIVALVHPIERAAGPTRRHPRSLDNN